MGTPAGTPDVLAKSLRRVVQAQLQAQMETSPLVGHAFGWQRIYQTRHFTCNVEQCLHVKTQLKTLVQRSGYKNLSGIGTWTSYPDVFRDSKFENIKLFSI